jgi:hypothetical protein
MPLREPFVDPFIISFSVRLGWLTLSLDAVDPPTIGALPVLVLHGHPE